MPLPSPRDDEHARDFVARCMRDPAIVSEFPRAAQRYAVCARQATRRTEQRIEVEGGLGISRTDMPQVPDARAFREWLRDQGIGIVPRHVEADQLIPAQGELDAAKVAAIRAKPDQDPPAPVLGSREGIILDGHHRWAAKLPDGDVLVWLVDLPMRDLLPLAHQFPGAQLRDVRGRAVEAMTCSRCLDPVPCAHWTASGELTETGRRANERARAREAQAPDSWGTCVECGKETTSSTWHHGHPDSAVCRSCYNASGVLHKCAGCDGSAGWEQAGRALSLSRKLDASAAR